MRCLYSACPAAVGADAHNPVAMKFLEQTHHTLSYLIAFFDPLGVLAGAPARASTEKFFVAVNEIGYFFLPVLHLASGTFAFANYSLPVWAPAVSIMGLVPGGLLFRSSHVQLGVNWGPTTELVHGHSVVTKCIYEHVRRPMYSGLWLVFGMCPLLLQNWFLAWVPVLGFGLL